jgi:hypothetical protein
MHQCLSFQKVPQTRKQSLVSWNIYVKSRPA